MVKSKLPNSVLRRVWALSDIDQDGMLDRDEFAVAMFLIDHKLAGNNIPEKLPERLIPPSKRARNRALYRGGSSDPSRDMGSYGGGGGYGREELPPSRQMDDYDDSSGLGGYIDN